MEIKESKYRLRICGVHVGYLCTWILCAYTNTFGIYDLRTHVRALISNEWGIWITGQSDIDTLSAMVREKYYENIADWLQEYMRMRLNNKTNHL